MGDVKEMGFHTYLSLLSLASPASLWEGMEAVELLSQSGLTLVSPCVSLLPSSQTRFSWFPVFTPVVHADPPAWKTIHISRVPTMLPSYPSWGPSSIFFTVKLLLLPS